MNNKLKRLASFADFPYFLDCANLIADKGFFATGSGDEVECSFCHKKFSRWLYYSVLSQRHKHVSPSCIHVKNIITNNRYEDEAYITGVINARQDAVHAVNARQNDSVNENSNIPQCIVCNENKREIAFFPCGHMCCQICRENVSLKGCSLCRKPITKFIKIYSPSL